MATCFPENLALNKDAWQIVPGEIYNGSDLVYLRADRAVDGFKQNLSWEGEQCVMSVSSRITAEWRVDLGGILSIHHIFIQYMTGNIVWGIVTAIRFIILLVYENY